MRIFKYTVQIMTAVALTAAIAGPASAQGAADFYKGKTVRIIVSLRAGTVDIGGLERGAHHIAALRK